MLFSQYLKFNLYTEPSDEYECVDSDNCLCNLCGEEYEKQCVSFIKDDNDKIIKIKSCLLCNIVVNFRNIYMGKCFLINTSISQKEINSKILKNFNLNKSILDTKDIDKDASIICIPLYEFITSYSNMTLDEKTLFNNFKIMFTGNVASLLQNKSTNYFSSINSTTNILNVSKYDLEYFKCDKYVLAKKQKKVLDHYSDRDDIKDIHSINKIKISLNNKKNDAVNKCAFVESLKSTK
jgi:hypothetical protein